MTVALDSISKFSLLLSFSFFAVPIFRYALSASQMLEQVYLV